MALLSATVAEASSHGAGATFRIVDDKYVQAAVGLPDGLAYVAHDELHIMTSTSLRHEGPAVGPALAATADGFVVNQEDGGFVSLRLLQHGESLPVHARAQAAAFGPDGALYVSALGQLLRMADGGPKTVLVGNVSFTHLAFSPDGTLYASRADTVYRVDGNTLHPVATSLGGVAFDDAGRMYTALPGQGRDLTLVRHDLAAGTNETLATTNSISWTYGLVGTSDRVYLYGYGLGYFEVGASMFVGFRPAFTAGDAPDLAVGEIEVLPVPGLPGQDLRRIQVTISNDGAADAGAFDVTMRRSSPVSSWLDEQLGGELFQRVEVAGLASGATTTVSFDWDATTSFGNHTLVVRADDTNRVGELVQAANNVGRAKVLVKADPWGVRISA